MLPREILKFRRLELLLSVTFQSVFGPIKSTIEPMTIFTMFMFNNRSLTQNLNGLNQIISPIYNLPLNLA